MSFAVLSLAAYMLLEGLLVFLVPRRCRSFTIHLLMQANRRSSGMLALAAGFIVFYLVPKEGASSFVLHMLGFPALFYGLLMTFPSDSALEEVRDAYNAYAPGQIMTLGAIEFSIGLVLLLATLAYLHLA